MPETAWITIPGTDIKSKWVLVTPQIAKHYLESNINNRNKRDKHVARLAKDMSAEPSRYRITHMGVAFDEDGIMIDGQHRLHAIILSGTNQWLLVTVNLEAEAKRVIDTGAKRGVADFMPGQFKSIRGAGIRIALACINMGGEITANTLAAGVQQITNAQIQENWNTFFDSDEEMTQMCHLAGQAARNVATCGPASLLAAGIMYEQTAKEFLTGIVTMTGLEHGDPRLALLKYRGGERRVQTPAAAFASLKCAKAFAESRKINVLRFSTAEVLKI